MNNNLERYLKSPVADDLRDRMVFIGGPRQVGKTTFALTVFHGNPTLDDFRNLLRYGGFPEPCLRGDERFSRRWQRERAHRVLYEDIRDLEDVKEISRLELLAAELPNRVGSPLSVKKLKELLEVAHETAERWLRIFERRYYCFRIPPYGPSRVRAVKKEQKLYLWDWSLVTEKGPRFENFIASHLLFPGENPYPPILPGPPGANGL